MDLLVEIVFEVYGELMLLIIPEKNVTPRMMWLSRLLAILSLAVVIGLVLLGVWMLADRNNLVGILPIVIAALISIAQITLGIVLYKRHH